LMYAQDYDETIPRTDNNGSAAYGWAPYLLPDWGSPGNYDPNNPPAMFANVVQPYIKNQQMGYCPEETKTDWRLAAPVYGGVSYDPRQEANGAYYGSFAQMAVNILIEEWHPSAQWHAGGVAPTGPIGSMPAWARPAELVLLTGDSVWDVGGIATANGVGNTGVWPANPYGNGPHCSNYGSPGWTWYVHKGARRSGDPGSVPGRYDSGINSGFANISFADGHTKAMKYNNLESCNYNTEAGFWTWTFWDPRY